MSSLPVDLFTSNIGFTPDLRFGGEQESVEPPVPVEDPLETAFSEGYERGFDAAKLEAEAAAREQDAARARIERAFDHLADTESQELEQRLRETILLLCENVLAPAAIDPDAIADRISRALGLLRRSGDERILRIHPEDLALVADRLAEGIHVEPDPSIGRGDIRVETVDGGLEDGPAHWRRVLSEALDL